MSQQYHDSPNDSSRSSIDLRDEKSTDTQYPSDESIDEEEGLLPANQNPAQTTPRPRDLIILIKPMCTLLMLFFTLGLVGFLAIRTADANRVAEISSGVQIQNDVIQEAPCGSTPSEARARGCHFDIMSFCWLPDRCYDEELSEEFQAHKTWEWYLDQNLTVPISQDDALSGEFAELYVDWEYHILHCTYMWRKMHRATMGPGVSAIDGYIGSARHTEHCGEMLLMNRDLSLGTFNTVIRRKYPACGMAW